MPLELGKDPNQHWYFFENNELKPVAFRCPSTMETPTEQLKVTTTSFDFPLQREFRLRLQVHPAGKHLLGKFIMLTRFHEHLASAIAAFQSFHNFPEPGFPESDLTVISSLLTDPVVNQNIKTASIVSFLIISRQHLMPQKIASPILDLDEIPEDECRHLLNFLWTKTSKDVSLTIIITCLK